MLLRSLARTLTPSVRGFSTSTPRMTKVAVVQLRSTNNVQDNLARSDKVIREAVAAGAKACFLPEASDYIAATADETRNLAQPLSQHEYALGLRKLAKELGVVIAAGIHDLPEDPQGDDRVQNTQVLIGTDGELLADYNKLHLFDVVLPGTPGPNGEQRMKRTGESDRIRPGQEVVPPIDVPGLGKVGLEICYDLRFPELHIILTRLGAQILTFPSAFTVKTGRDHWATLCYQVYVLAATQYGLHNPGKSGRTSWGEALAFDPWGRQLGRLRSMGDGGDEAEINAIYDTGGEYFICDVDVNNVGEVKKQLPLADQKRADIYGVVGKEVPKKPIE
ncbi:nitrilase-like protein [Trichosporon asahii var. asahii CBS 8904]|uniref:Nitrilase-like protein n=1 Tax=Trichosporon asahii var. asahii (strain CBS 8904) TaxID=1220162 RepID=K1VLP8_TRIAC|nr:nitrilase-like protein [Trichosporon asahii var. asahii CBS 8904]